MAKAVCIIENPKKECTLIVKGGVNKTVFPDQKVTFKINDTLLEEFIPEEALFSKEYTITPGTDGTWRRIFPEVSRPTRFLSRPRSFPDSTDSRELGMQVFFVYFREKIQVRRSRSRLAGEYA
ncbi:MAG: hypothetical protein M0C28_19170 [Candidatus Moduliflexus flocculans]|nr:hypothetical protein [Candidatus Moduliflexus flocculans]